MQAPCGPWIVNSVNFKGINYTSPKYLEKISAPIWRCRDRDEFLREAEKSISRLRALDALETIELRVEPLNNGVNVYFDCEENKRFFLKTSSDIGSNNIGAKLEGKISNVSGNLEHLNFNYFYDVDFNNGLNYNISKFPRSASFEVSLAKQLVKTFKLGDHLSPLDVSRLEFSAFNTSKGTRKACSYKENQKGASVTYKMGLPASGLHEISYTAMYRHFYGFTSTIPRCMRKYYGFNTKSAIKYTYICDSRDSLAFPSSGKCTRTSLELSGAPGDAKYVKFDAGSIIAHSISENWSANFILKGGAVFGNKIHISDKFLLGGSHSIRGFELDGIGPVSLDHRLGGEAYWRASLSLFTPLPRIAQDSIRGHLFLNSGALIDRIAQTNPLKSIKRSFNRPVLSAGFGLAFGLGPIKIELNYVLPLACSETDSVTPGFNISIGAEAL